MKTFLTEFQAISPKDGSLRRFAGPNILAKSWEDAVAYCSLNAEHLEVVGELVDEPIDELSNYYEAIRAEIIEQLEDLIKLVVGEEFELFEMNTEYFLN